MTRTELGILLKDNNSDFSSKMKASDVAFLMRFTDVSMKIDEKSLDYFYEMDIDGLLKSEMPNKLYEDVIVRQGWFIDGDKLKVFIR